MRELCTVLPWDSDFFGIRIARLNSTAPSAEDFDAATEWCHQRSVRCLYFLCDSNAKTSARQAGHRGFDLMDMRITMASRNVADHRAARMMPEVLIRPALDHDLAALRELSGRSFTEMRFFADSHFPKERVRALYECWVDRDFASPGRMVLMAEMAGHFAGFVTGSLESDGSGLVGLIATHERARGKGIGSALMDELLRGFQGMSASKVVVVTSGCIPNAMRLYENLGFRTELVQFWFHRWFNEGELDCPGEVR